MKKYARFGLIVLFILGLACAFSGSAEAVPSQFLTNLIVSGGGQNLIDTGGIPEEGAVFNASVASDVSSVVVTPTPDGLASVVTSIDVTNGTPATAREAAPYTVTLGAAGTATTIVLHAASNIQPALGTEHFTIRIARAAGGGEPTVPVSGIVLSPKVLSLDLKDKKTGDVTATLTPSNATNTSVYWKSSDTKVATVSASGSSSPNNTIAVTAVGVGRDDHGVDVGREQTGHVPRDGDGRDDAGDHDGREPGQFDPLSGEQQPASSRDHAFRRVYGGDRVVER